MHYIFGPIFLLVFVYTVGSFGGALLWLIIFVVAALVCFVIWLVTGGVEDGFLACAGLFAALAMLDLFVLAGTASNSN
jgi:hypothetical protein